MNGSPDRRTAIQECRPFLEVKYPAYTSWGEGNDLPKEVGFNLAFEELLQDCFMMGAPDDCVRELWRHRDAVGITCFIFRSQ